MANFKERLTVPGFQGQEDRHHTPRNRLAGWCSGGLSSIIIIIGQVIGRIDIAEKGGSSENARRKDSRSGYQTPRQAGPISLPHPRNVRPINNRAPVCQGSNLVTSFARIECDQIPFPSLFVMAVNRTFLGVYEYYAHSRILTYDPKESVSKPA
jgi:hypothetical protein